MKGRSSRKAIAEPAFRGRLSFGPGPNRAPTDDERCHETATPSITPANRGFGAVAPPSKEPAMNHRTENSGGGGGGR
jgi:hypothetical protein